MYSVHAKHIICSYDCTTKVNNCVRRKKTTCVLGSALLYISVITETLRQGRMIQFHIEITTFNSSKYEENFPLGKKFLSKIAMILQYIQKGKCLAQPCE